MPLFKCSKCGCIENTACGNYWGLPPDEPPTCSECDTGKWHGHFPKKTPEEMGYVPLDNRGFNSFYGPKGGWK